MNLVTEWIRNWKREYPQEPFCSFVYNLGELKRRTERIVAALPDGARYYYAVKANSDQEVIRTLEPVVHGFETASLGEIEKVREVSKHCPILFGGPGKTDNEIEGAIRSHVTLLHIESIGELYRTNWIAGLLGRTVKVLLRVNLRGPLPHGTLQMCGVPSQFGIDEADIPLAAAAAKQCSNIELCGFHFHSVSNQLNAAAHAEMVKHYLRRADEWQMQLGIRLRYVNTGGGIGINYENLDDPFDWDVFVRLLNGGAGSNGGGEGAGPELLFECGRYTVASCGYYAAEVLDLRRIGDTYYAVINGGLHHFLLPGAWKHRHPFYIVPIEKRMDPEHREEVRGGPLTLVGRMNSPRDILLRDASVPSIRTGDVIVFPYAGAYGWSISAHDFSSLDYPSFVYLHS